MKTWHMIIDVALCTDCNNCFLADKDEFVGNDFPPYSVGQPWYGQRWIDIDRKERGQYPMVDVAYLPTPCQHCDDAPCIAAAPAGSIYKRADGLVIIDPAKAKGQPEIVDTCPYGVIFWNDEAQVAQKCTGCAHLLDEGWKDTRCSQVCPSGALRLVLAEEDEFVKFAAAEGLEVLRPELGSNPRVHYKNLHKWSKVFVGGSAVFADTDECAEGARAVLTLDGKPAGEAITDNYGDFKIDRLEPGVYGLTLSASGYEDRAVTVDAAASVSLGVVVLERT
jgi:Fe-S-cluster-containing dehydrogenase component